jgi:thiopurine S-methyltransferase
MTLVAHHNKIDGAMKGWRFECFETEGIQIYCGDFFVLPTQVLKEISAVYDRASLVA